MSSQTMSGTHHSTPGSASPKTATQEIELTARFAEQMAQLCMSQMYSDVTFIVDDLRLPAHRVILAARSSYFNALLYGGMKESQQNEIKLDVPLKAFKALLRYIYSGCMSLSVMEEEHILDTLGLANQYGFDDLEKSISIYLRQVLSLGNVCTILDAARLYGLDSLSTVCHLFVDRNAAEILKHETFYNLSLDSLVCLLDRDSFFATEVNIFQAVFEWCRANTETLSKSDINSVIGKVRFSLMTVDELLTVVRPSGILDPDRLLDAIAEKISCTQLPYRGALCKFIFRRVNYTELNETTVYPTGPEENVATAKFNSHTIIGEMRSALLDGDTVSYDLEKGYTRHSIGEKGESHGIVVELGKVFIINHIKMLLWDRDSRSYNYYIEVSVNQRNWVRVVDNNKHVCRSWQQLFFPARAVRYIRLVGTYNIMNKVFHVVALEAMYTASTVPVVEGILMPTDNVATVECGAFVKEGVSRIRNVLLNRVVQSYDWDSGYTCHQIGTGVILIQLGQPYWISSLRLLLWDRDNRSYSFFIEASTDMKHWEFIADKRRESLQSWQHFSFPPKVIVYIRIVGTANTANEMFHCVHFECPSQDPNFINIGQGSGASLETPAEQERLEAPPEQQISVNERIAAAEADAND